jgi:hypothetical protein
MSTATSTPSWRPRDRELLNQYAQLLHDLLRAAPLDASDIGQFVSELSQDPFVLPEVVPTVWAEHERYSKALAELGKRLSAVKVSLSVLKRELIRIIEQEARWAYDELSTHDLLGGGAHTGARAGNGGGRPAAGPSGGGSGSGGGGGGGARRSARRDDVRSANGGEHEAAAAPPPPAPAMRNGGETASDDEDMGDEDLLLSAEPGETAAAAPEQPAPAPRWINADIENLERSQPLNVGTKYVLAFDVDVRARSEARGSTQLLKFDFPPGLQQVELTVQLETNDFEVAGKAQKLTLERNGPSLDKARFRITPRREGEGKIDAIFHRDGNFVQRLSLTLQVGSTQATITAPAVASAGTGRPLAAAAMVQSRDVSILVENRNGAYEMSLLKPVARRVTLTVTEKQLQERLEEVRSVLLGIVQQTDAAGKKVFQRGLKIDDASNQAALRSLAEIGHKLYAQLFFRPGGGPEARRFGQNLRRNLLHQRCNVQVTCRNFPIPWGLLYLAEKWEPEKPIDPELFLGLRHVLEQIPLVDTDDWPPGTIPTDQPDLSVSLNVNRGIDKQMKRPFVKDQIDYWNSLAEGRGQRVRYVVRDSAAMLRTALEDTGFDDHVLYLFCHAASYNLDDPKGPDASSLVFEDGKSLTLGELYQQAGTAGTLRSAPLVFINACESAELSPLFYDGFVPYFMLKGARGAIGTECATPALFAAEWAKRFFELFLTGLPIGECVYRLRREFYEEHQNILGLLYTVYCDGDTQIAPSVLAN